MGLFIQGLGILFFCLFVPAMTEASNKLKDVFNVLEVTGDKAIVTGEPKGLKARDKLYFPRPPFQFTIEKIEGNEITVKLPKQHDLSTSHSLMRNMTPIIKKNIDTEKKLREALGEE